MEVAAQCRELFLAPSAANAQDNTPFREYVQRSDHLGVEHRVPVRENLYGYSQAESPSYSSQVGEEGKRLVDVLLRGKLGDSRGAAYVATLGLDWEGHMVAGED